MEHYDEEIHEEDKKTKQTRKVRLVEDNEICGRKRTEAPEEGTKEIILQDHIVEERWHEDGGPRRREQRGVLVIYVGRDREERRMREKKEQKRNERRVEEERRNASERRQ